MANKFRYRSGPTNPVNASVATALGVEMSDLVGASSGNVYKASEVAWGATGLSGAQTSFAAKFLGSAAQQKIAGQTRAYAANKANFLRINTLGIFEFDCFASTFEIGDLVGPAAASTGSSLENQKVELVTDKARAIGTIIQKKPTAEAALTTCMVQIFSSVASVRALDAT